MHVLKAELTNQFAYQVNPTHDCISDHYIRIVFTNESFLDVKKECIDRMKPLGEFKGKNNQLLLANLTFLNEPIYADQLKVVLDIVENGKSIENLIIPDELTEKPFLYENLTKLILLFYHEDHVKEVFEKMKVQLTHIITEKAAREILAKYPSATSVPSPFCVEQAKRTITTFPQPIAYAISFGQ